eukprot:scaffold65_cov172-Skeletonema_menzelii.AAC.1
MHMQQQFATQFSRNPWSTSAAALRGPGGQLIPHFSNGRVGMGLGESDLQAQHQGEDELWEAQFIAERSALVARMKKEQLEKQRDESRKLQIVASEYAEKRMRLHKSGKTHAPTGSPTVDPIHNV